MTERKKNLVIVLEVSPQGAPAEFKVCDAVTAEVIEDAVTFSEDTLTEEILADGYVPIQSKYANIRFDTLIKEIYVKAGE